MTYEMKKGKFYTACRESGDIIDEFNTIEEAEAAIARYEEEDKADDIYEEAFYEVRQC